MHQRSQQKNKQYLAKLAGLILISAALTACGGGGNSSSSGEVKRDDHAKPIPVINKTEFIRQGIDVQLRSSISGMLDAEIDGLGRVTFNSPENDQHLKTPYKFTFKTGLPGGEFANGNIMASILTMTDKEENKQVSLLYPHLTKQVQNVFWVDTQNPSIYGLSTVGFALKPKSVTWPASGTAVYKGHAFQYIQDWIGTDPEVDANALVTSDVTATVDFSAKTITFVIAPEATVRHITPNSSVNDLPLNRFGATFGIKDLEFAGDQLHYVKYEFGLSDNGESSLVTSLNFFGENAEEMGGLAWLSKTQSSSEPSMLSIHKHISFALKKQ